VNFSPDPDLLASLPSGTVSPDLAGGSIANLPAAIGAILGVQAPWPSPPLREPLLQSVGSADRVILLLVDGVGFNRLARSPQGAGEGSFPIRLGTEVLLRSQLTSVLPSTTAAATTVLLAGGALPLQTGFVGYTSLLPRLGFVANLIRWNREGSEEGVGSLEEQGFVPEEALPVPTTAELLKGAGVPVAAFLPNPIARSPLSRMQFRGTDVSGYLNSTDLWWQLAGWEEESRGERSFAYAHFPDFDGLSHRDGPETPLWDLYLRELDRGLALFGGLLERNRARGGEGGRTVLLLTADHGHVFTPAAAASFFEEHPELAKLCRLPPGGEARHVNLYARPGRVAQLLDYCHGRLGEKFVVLEAQAAIEGGLYGVPGHLEHPEGRERIGDVLLLARGQNYLWPSGNPARLLGMHGSLHPDEMLVPLIALEL